MIGTLRLTAYIAGMITELGHFALMLAFGVAIIQMIVPLVGAAKGWSGWMAVDEPAATVQFLLVAASFGALTWAFVTSDFSLAVVVANSHSMKPMIYKISGTWGNHEGSMLLWVLIVALFGAMAAWFGSQLPAALRARAAQALRGRRHAHVHQAPTRMLARDPGHAWGAMHGGLADDGTGHPQRRGGHGRVAWAI